MLVLSTGSLRSKLPRWGWLATAARDAGATCIEVAPGAPSGSDEQLVAAAKYGDPDAFDRLVARHVPHLHAVARRLVGDDLAHDVVQDSLLAAYRSLSRFRGQASFASYLHGIVLNRARRLAPRWRALAPPGDAIEEVPATEPGPEDRAIRSDIRHRVERAIGAVPRPFRETLALREFGNLSYSEIAAVLGVPVGTVRSRIARARDHVRETLERQGVHP